MGLRISVDVVGLKDTSGYQVEPKEGIKASPYTWEIGNIGYTYWNEMQLTQIMPYMIHGKRLKILSVTNNVHLSAVPTGYEPSARPIKLENDYIVDLSEFQPYNRVYLLYKETNSRVLFYYPYHSKTLLDKYFYPNHLSWYVTDNRITTYEDYDVSTVYPSYTTINGFYRILQGISPPYVNKVVLFYSFVGSTSDYYPMYRKVEYKDADGVWQTIEDVGPYSAQGGRIYIYHYNIEDYCSGFRISFAIRSSSDPSFTVRCYYSNLWGSLA